MSQQSLVPPPSIRVTGLHIRKLRAIRALDLPAAGLGWNGAIPAVSLVGGPNGAGKTTLFEFIARVFHLLLEQPKGLPVELGQPKTEARMDIEVALGGGSGTLAVRYLQGTKAFVDQHATDHCFGYQYTGVSPRKIFRGDATRLRAAAKARSRKTPLPSILFLPSDERDLHLPAEKYKALGRLPEPDDFVYRWRPPRSWKDSLEALLYSLRWEDLNAKEEGRAANAGNFEAYASELAAFTGGSRTLRWHHGELVVEVDGERHALSELSSGEKQVLILTAELRRRWRPGSLVLIDEPELHLHDAWQTKLYERVLALQRERGGQVWLASQSGHLFEVAEPNSRLLLKTGV